MSVAASIDSAKQEAFVGQVLANTSAAMVTTLAALGDRLGLFKTLAASGPATSAEIAARAGVVERYAREWLGGMTSAGYVTYAAYGTGTKPVIAGCTVSNKSYIKFQGLQFSSTNSKLQFGSGAALKGKAMDLLMPRVKDKVLITA